MSARLPSRWLFLAALLAAEGLTSAAVAQSPVLPGDSRPGRPCQTVPATTPLPAAPFRLAPPPLLLEEEQTSEQCDLPRAIVPLAPAMAPRVLNAPGLPGCDDDDRLAAAQVTLRCLLFSVNPFLAFLPLEVGQSQGPFPGPDGLVHPPGYFAPPPDSALSPQPPPEPVGMPVEVERIHVMPKAVEQLDVMPTDEECEPHFELLGPWIDSAQLFGLPALPRMEVQLSVAESRTGSLLFGLGTGSGAGLCGNFVVCAEPPPAPAAPRPLPAAPVQEKGLAQVRLSIVLAELDRKGARKLHLDHSPEGKTSRWVIEVADEARSAALVAGLTGLREKGHAKLLATPELITLSGQTASLLCGGEMAIPEPAGTGPAGVRFEDFGTRINCLPTVLADGTVRLEVEPEVSEFCEVKTQDAKHAVVPSRSLQRVHTAAEVARNHTLVISGPKAGGETRIVVFVTPTVVAAKAPPGATPAMIPQMIFEFGKATRGCLDSFADLFAAAAPPGDSNERMKVLLNQSENLRQIEYEMEQFWMVDQPSRLTPERVHGGVEGGETVHGLLLKCQRELEHGHYAGAQDLAQQAIERDARQVAADPLVCQSGLLQRVKETASLPLGTIEPCAAKAGGSDTVPAGEAKAIGSVVRMVQALMQAYHVAYREGRYRDAEALAVQAQLLDPDSPCAGAALQIARMQQQSGRRKTAREPEIERRLDANVSLKFEEVPLGTVIDNLRTMQGIDIVPDVRALQDAGVSLREPLTFHVDNMTLRSALKLLLKPIALTYVIQDEALWITTPELARGKSVIALYAVTDLVTEKAEGDPVKRLMDLLQDTTAPWSWACKGGRGTIEFDAKTQNLIVNQTTDVQEQVADMFGALRRLSGETGKRERQHADAIGQFQADFRAARYEEAKLDALRALAAMPGDPVAAALLHQAAEALSRLPLPEPVPQCTCVGTGLRPSLPPIDPAVVRALQKLLIDTDKVGPVGGTEEAEPKPRR
jgi:hypothetical protein